MHKILSILLENEFGALSRVIGLFSQRGYNIESVTVSPTEDSSISQMTIQTKVENENIVEQIKKQLYKLINVLQVQEIGIFPHIEREILLIKLKLDHEKIKDVILITKIFKGKIVHITNKTIIIQITGTNKKITDYIQIIKKKNKILEIARSGIIGILKN
ncbi:acetolactate synthase small subunit [Buchnera aphidicola (Thelaxes californica)]|uniref:Acetolactate synthase small subunit n=2 Tax=Buchnera aphidicola TaxID=9 RepID=A0A4D6YLR4_9GAMM|nr:acetolactate synthase small subunit [Buchnera aphidicola (Thelaxes californica)]